MTPEPTDLANAEAQPLERPRLWGCALLLLLVGAVGCALALYWSYIWPLAIGAIAAYLWADLKVLEGAKVPTIVGAVAILLLSVAGEIAWLVW